MHLPLSHAIAPHLHLLDEVGSTNAELVARASSGEAQDFTVVVTTNQTAGRGRLDTGQHGVDHDNGLCANRAGRGSRRAAG